jgi:hypothetical protein
LVIIGRRSWCFPPLPGVKVSDSWCGGRAVPTKPFYRGWFIAAGPGFAAAVELLRSVRRLGAPPGAVYEWNKTGGVGGLDGIVIDCVNCAHVFFPPFA